MTRTLKDLTRLAEVGRVMRKGQHFVDTSGTILHGIYHAGQESTAHTIVFIHGTCVADYSYPCIDRRFSSPMVNDFNLHFVGRWRWLFENEGRTLVERIAAQLKPAGLIAVPEEHGPALLQEAMDAGLATVYQDDDARGVRYLGFSVQGRFEDLFDLECLIADYTTYERAFLYPSPDLENTIESMVSRVKNDTIISHVEPYLCMNPKDVAGIITSGLVFGYPIETTVAFLAGTIA